MINWQLSYLDTDWVDYYNISNPTNELEQIYNSNRTKYNLYDGSIARTIPTNKIVYGETTLEFDLIPQDDTLITDVNMTGTYSQTTTTITITIVAHGITNGSKVNLDFTSGTYTTNGVYTATKTGDDTFTIPCATGTSTGNVTLIKSKSLRTIINEGKRIKLKTHLTENNTRLVLDGYLIDIGKPWNVGLMYESGTYKQFFSLSCTLDIIGETWV